MENHYDVIVVGKGNAALCAALAARDTGATVLVMEAASQEESGGNSRFAGGVMRFAYESVDDLKRVTELTDQEIADTDFGTNTTDEYFDDLFRLTQFRTDPELSEILVRRSLDTMVWLREKGVRFVPNYGQWQAAFLWTPAHRSFWRRCGPGGLSGCVCPTCRR